MTDDTPSFVLNVPKTVRNDVHHTARRLVSCVASLLGDHMRCRARLLGSIALGLGLVVLSGPSFAERSDRAANGIVPALTPAEARAAFAPVGSGAATLPAIAPAPSMASAPGPDLPAPAASSPAASSPAASSPAATAPAGPVEPQPGTLPAGPAAPLVPAQAAPVATPPPAVAISAEPAASPADLVRAAMASALDAIVKPSADQSGLRAFYGLRGNEPAFVADGALTAAGRAILDRLAAAAADGLDPRVYEVPAIATLSGPGTSADHVAEAEIGLSAAILAYARNASSGRVNVKSIGRDILATDNMPDPTIALASVLIAADPVSVLDGFNPPHPQFAALRTKLAEVRAADRLTADAVPPPVPAGPILKIGMVDARVAALRTRLGLTMTDADLYDDAVAEAVRAFQRERRLKANGVLGPQTLAALNGVGKGRRISVENEIISNMERWRWLPRDLGASNVFVNVPEYRLEVTRDGVPVHESRIIVGKPATPTPIFSDTMEFVVLNPSWNVPQSIIRKEYMPKLMDDPDYLARRGFIVTYQGNTISVRQPPGEQNALGHIKFMFPNNFSVYLHDTSSRNLFASDKRAFSHGCVRVDQPYKFAEIVMGAENGWTEERVRDSVGGRERRVDLKQKIPVHITYFTAKVDETGDLKLIDDIYGYDLRVLGALGLAGEGPAERSAKAL